MYARAHSEWRGERGTRERSRYASGLPYEVRIGREDGEERAIRHRQQSLMMS